jgi:hypothetical protein
MDPLRVSCSRDPNPRLVEEESVIMIRPAAERGQTDWGWLDSRHTFSLGEYCDPRTLDPARHGGASGRYAALRDRAFGVAWMLKQVGVTR